MKKTLWIVPLVAGAITPPVYWYFFVRDYTVAVFGGDTYKRSDLREMANHGVNTDNFLFVGQAYDKTRYKHRTLNRSEWDRVVTIALKADWYNRLQALNTLEQDALLGDHTQEATTIFRNVLTHPSTQSPKSLGEDKATDDTLRETSLRYLCVLKATGWQDDARRALNDPELADTAKELLK